MFEAQNQLNRGVKKRRRKRSKAREALQVENFKRKRAERILRFQDNILSQLSEAVVAVDNAGYIFYWNHQAELLYGVQQQEAINRHIEDIYQERWLSPEEEQAAYKTLREKGVWQGENIHIKKSGEEIYVASSVSIIKDEKDSTIGVLTLSRDISSQKAVEKQLKQAEEKLSISETLRLSDELLKQMPDAIVITDLQGNIQKWMGASEQIYGYSAAEVIGKPVHFLHQPEIRDIMTAKIDAELQETGKFSGEIPCLHKDGSEIVIEAKTTTFYDEANQPLFLISIRRDITQRNKTEAELHRREQELKALFEHTPDIIIRCDREGRYLYVNPEAERVAGLSAAEMIGKTSSELGIPEQLCRVWNGTISKVFETGQEQTIEFKSLTIDGLRDYQSRVAPEFDKDGAIQYALIVVRDITEYKRGELERTQLICEQAARAEAEAGQKRVAFLAQASKILAASLEYEKTLDSVAQLAIPTLADFCFFDLLENNGSIRRVALAYADTQKQELFAKLYDYVPNLNFHQHPAAKVIATGVCEFVPDANEDWMLLAASSAEEFQLMRQLNFCSLISVPVIVRDRSLGALTFCFSQSGRYYTLADLALAEELAHRAALAVENATLYRQSQEANRLKDEFLAVVSHELRTPLNSVLGFTQLLRTHKLDEAATERAFAAIERNAKSQVKLVEDILEFSRLIGGKLSVKFRPVKLVLAIYGAIDLARPLAKAKDIEIVNVLDVSLIVLGDRDRLQQIIFNILSNAVKFTSKGGRIEVNLTSMGELAQIQIVDNGRGISPEFMPYLFESFRQSEKAIVRTEGGLGLGLALTRQLVQLHNGAIYAESQGDSKGAIFTVQLPLLTESKKYNNMNE